MNNQIPCWIKKRVSLSENYYKTLSILKEYKVSTVCENALCPNVYECFGKSYTSFMILGDRCTRNCKFCDVNHLPPTSVSVDTQEPLRISKAIKKLGMTYVVITSPTRDDILDGGASHFATVVKVLKDYNPNLNVEVLIPDFKGNKNSIETVLKSKPDLISHNIETIEKFYSNIRPTSNYKTSLNVLKEISKNGFTSKSGFMLGFGETENEVFSLMEDIKTTGCDYLVIGQYLRPSKESLEVKEYLYPDIFKKYEDIGIKLGFKNVFAGTFYRSSYLAEKLINHKKKL